MVGALKHETISLVCGVQSKPPPLTFHWTFNNSGEMMNVPPTRYTQVKSLRLITNNWHGSRLNYTPANDMDYGTVACWARNRIGVQKTPCLFQIIVAGKPYSLQNCSALQSTGPYAFRMGKMKNPPFTIKLVLPLLPLFFPFHFLSLSLSLSSFLFSHSLSLSFSLFVFSFSLLYLSTILPFLLSFVLIV